MDPVLVPFLHQALHATYGSICKRNVNYLSALLQKLAITTAGLEFLVKCRQFNVVPAFISKAVKFSRLGPHMERIASKLPLRMLRAAIRDLRVRLGRLQKDTTATWMFLYRIILDTVFWNALTFQKDNYFASILFSETTRLKRKFIRLFAVYPNHSYTDGVTPPRLQLPLHGRLTSALESATRRLEPVSSEENDRPPVVLPSRSDKFRTADSNDASFASSSSVARTDLWAPRQVPSETHSHSPSPASLCSWESHSEHCTGSSLWDSAKGPQSSRSPSPASPCSWESHSEHCTGSCQWDSAKGPQSSPSEKFFSLESVKPSGSPETFYSCQSGLKSDVSLNGSEPDQSSLLHISSFESTATPAVLALGLDRAFLASSSSPDESTANGENANPSSLEFSFGSELVHRSSSTGKMESGDQTSLEMSFGPEQSADPASLEMSFGPEPPLGPGSVADIPGVLPNCQPSQESFSKFIPVIVRDDKRLKAEVINFSSISLSAVQCSVINESLKFRQTPKKIPYMELIASIEGAAKEMERREMPNANHFRIKCANVINSASKPELNLKPFQSQILKTLSENKSIVITQADKGGKATVLDQNQYTAMCLQHLEDPVYELVKDIGLGQSKVVLEESGPGQPSSFFNQDFLSMDASDKLMRQQCAELTSLLISLMKSRQLHPDEKKLISPASPYAGTFPKFYGLPKAHKLGPLLLRPIIACYGLYSDALLIKLKQILNLLIWGSTTLSNSYELVQILEDYENFGESDRLISFDVRSLYTRVPVDECLNVVEDRLIELAAVPDSPLKEITSMTTNAIMKLLKLVLSQCFFTWEGTLYRQSSGLPMGGRLSPILANIYMENLEYAVLCTAPAIPKLYFRYVDDVFVLWNEEQGSHRQFLDRLNQQHPSIEMTEELEVEGSLPFLDVCVTRPKAATASVSSNLLQISIYRKETHADRYLHYNSAHPMSLKRSIVRGLHLRAYRLLKSFPTQLEIEIKHLRMALTAPKNAYPPHVINRWFKDFEIEIRMKPQLLKVKSALVAADLLDQDGCQKFRQPTAIERYPPDQKSSTSENTVTSVENPDTQLEVDGLEMELEDENEQNGEDNVRDERPVVIMPYIPILGDRLRKLATDSGLRVWFSYPGKIYDMFSEYRGRQHISKARHVVYQCQCNCGVRYVGESGRNVKVRIAEHLRPSSTTAISHHLKKNKGHNLVSKDTVILATEKNFLKRRMLESMCIRSKASRLCNNKSRSIDISPVWDLCEEAAQRQLSRYD